MPSTNILFVKIHGWWLSVKRPSLNLNTFVKVRVLCVIVVLGSGINDREIVCVCVCERERESEVRLSTQVVASSCAPPSTCQRCLCG
jgi:hypothetical protein